MKSLSDSRCRFTSARVKMRFFLTVFCSMFVACSWLPSSYRQTPAKLIRDAATTSPYQKKIGIAPIGNISDLKGQGLEKIYERTLIDSIKSQAKNALIITPQDPGRGEFLKSLPKLENGVVDNLTLSKDARREGYNAIVSGTITAITTKKERSGIWWSRKDHYYLQILIIIESYDPYDGAKIYSESMLTESEISKEEADKIKAGDDIKRPLLKETIIKMAEDAGSAISSAVDSRIWKGFITSADQKDVTLSCGEMQGIRSGSQFEVYDSADIIDGHGGQKFFVPGYKIGEIEITQVRADRSTAKVLTQNPLPVGSVVIPKND
jgi:hypothetical protein